MTKIPSFIAHYHLADCQPFLTLSDLQSDEEDNVFKALRDRHKYDPSYQRRYGSAYLSTRRKIERQLRHLFVERGGTPERKYPFYFVLGESKWLKGLVKEHLEIRIDIDSLNPKTTSFTFPDSYIALSRNDKPYHGKVFILSELRSVVEKYGLPADTNASSYRNYWEGDFEKYIELQIWDNKTVQPFIDKYLSS